MWQNINRDYGKSGLRIDAALHAFPRLHLHYSDNAASLKTNLYVFSLVAILILLIACVNYINLSTAMAFSRFKEIGVRKVLGANRRQLIGQFIGESLLVTFIAFAIAVLLVLLFLPAYNTVLDSRLSIAEAGWGNMLLFMLAMMMVIGIGGGSYLAFYLSSLNVTKVLKSAGWKNGHNYLGKILIVFQFAITTALMTCTLIIYLQLHYTKNKSLGFDKEHTIVFPLTGNKVRDNADFLKQKIAVLPMVKKLSLVSEVPYNGITTNGFQPEGSNSFLMWHQLDADENLVKALGLNMVSGNYFSPQMPTNADGYVINEALARKMEWNNPIGKIINRDGPHRVIGIVKDFNFASLHDQIEPLIITNKPWQGRFGYLLLHYEGDKPSALIAQVNEIWKQSFADAPFEYWFLDDAYNEVYKTEQHFQQLFFCFSALSILLSVAGIFGLVTLSMRRRTKEIGIRKVLGANVRDILQMVAGNFMLLILLASLIAIPVAWYYMHLWIRGFAFHISLRWWYFIIAGALAAVIALLTIVGEAVKAARANPVKNLRTE